MVGILCRVDARLRRSDNGTVLDRSLFAAAAAVAGGCATWSAVEYLVHRHGFHGPDLRFISSEHTAHHRDPLATSPIARTVGHLAVAATAIAPGLLAGSRSVTGVGIGMAAGYSNYEIVHWRLHHRPERSNPALVRHHERHHRGAPRRNFGVTTTFWDQRAGTLEPT